jgi:hypothetical protein
MTTTTIPPVADVIREIRALAAERPDFIYRQPVPGEGCKYVHRRSSGTVIPNEGCIVGQACARLGWIPPEEWEGTSAVRLLDLPRDPDTARPITPEGDWITEVQAAQDGGNTWADAVAQADENMPLP